MATTTPSGLPSWIGPQPPVPEPRSLSGEMTELTPYLGQLTGMSNDMFRQNTMDLARMQRAQTQWQSEYNYDFLMSHYQPIADQEIMAQQKALAAQRNDALKYAYDYGDAWTWAMRDANPSLLQQIQQLDAQVAKTGQPSALTGGLDTLALGQLYTGPQSRWSGSLDDLVRRWNSTAGATGLTGSLDKMAAAQLHTGPTTPFTSQLDSQILRELKLGGAMTPEEERMVQQSSREAFAARGMAMSDPASLAEVLNRDSYSQARLRERQGLAAEREQMGIQRQLLGQQFGASRESSELQRRQIGLQLAGTRELQELQQKQIGMQFGASREAAAMQRDAADRQFLLGATELTNSMNPMYAMLGMQGYGVPQSSSILGYTQPSQIQQSQDIFAPMGTAGLSYGQDLYSGNMNLQADLYNNWMNNAASIYGAQTQAAAAKSAAGAAAGGQIAGAAIGGVGAIGSAAIGAAASAAIICWVAREVYGPSDKRWRTFRVWLVLEAPKELRDFYREHGQNIAKLVARSQIIKALLRSIMDPIAQ